MKISEIIKECKRRRGQNEDFVVEPLPKIDCSLSLHLGIRKGKMVRRIAEAVKSISKNH